MVWKFRALILAQWLVPLSLIIIEALMTFGQPAEPLVPTSGAVTVGFLVAFVVSEVGLWQFRAWAPRTFLVVVAVYAITVPMLGPVQLTGVTRLVLLLDGVGLGAIATWLLVARDTLPFPEARVVAAEREQ